MKNLKLGATALALAVSSAVFAQTTSNPWLIGVGAHGVNHNAVAKAGVGDIFKTAIGGNGGALYNIGNYTIIPPLSKLTVARNLSKSFVADWQTSVGNVENKRFATGKEFFLMTGLGLQYKANSLWNENSWFDPYLRVGANYLRHDYDGTGLKRGDGKILKADHFTLATGIGTNIWLTKNFGLGIQGDYVSTPFNKSFTPNFWQASASLLFRFGQKDRDKDGILDKDDECPDEFGLKELNGCPDTDGDGIADKNDSCPDVAGPAENQGCPWKDSDGDNVLDKDDACPEVAGPVENNGCPWKDTDGDGVLDKDDECPAVPGLREYKGCPKPQVEIAKDTTRILQGITFDFNKSTINAVSNDKLDQAAEVIKSSNGGTFLVTGHTDAKGSAAINLKLSRERAAAVVKALEARGVAETQLKSKGVGSRDAQVPVTASNEERERDRKVVVEAIDGAAWNAIQKSDVPANTEKKQLKKALLKKILNRKK